MELFHTCGSTVNFVIIVVYQDNHFSETNLIATFIVYI